MSHRIKIEEAKQKLKHEHDIQEKNKQGLYHSDRIKKREEKRVKKETTWFDYIKRRGGIKEKKEEKKQCQDLEKDATQSSL